LGLQGTSITTDSDKAQAKNNNQARRMILEFRFIIFSCIINFEAYNPKIDCFVVNSVWRREITPSQEKNTLCDVKRRSLGKIIGFG